MSTETSIQTSWAMPGGMRFGTYKADRITDVLDPIDPSEVIIPIGIPQGDALVTVGDAVQTGQALVPDNLILPGAFHLSTVTGVIDRFIAHGKGMRAPSSVVIKRTADGDDEYGETAYPDPSGPEDARALMIRSGIIHACSENIGTWIMNGGDTEVTAIVLSGMGTSPHSSGGIGLATANTEVFKEGLRLWRIACADAPASIAISKNDISQWNALGLTDVSFVVLPDRYPWEHPVMLASKHLGRDLPAGTTPLQYGIAVIDIAAVLAAGTVMRTRRSLSSVYTAICGEACTKNAAFTARIGTPAGEVRRRLAGNDAVLVVGGLLSGSHLQEESPILPRFSHMTAIPLPQRRFMGWAMPAPTRHSWTRTVFSALLPGIKLEAKAELGGEKRPCISCGECENVCPRDISPSYLFKVADADVIEEMELYGIDRCIECGLCSYVCPSKIELMEKIVAGIRRLEAERAE